MCRGKGGKILCAGGKGVNLMCRGKGGLTPGSRLGRIPAWTRQIHCQVNLNLWMHLLEREFTLLSFKQNSTCQGVEEVPQVVRENCSFPAHIPRVCPAGGQRQQRVCWERVHEPGGCSKSKSKSKSKCSRTSYVQHLTSNILHLTFHIQHIHPSTDWSPTTGRLTMRNVLLAPPSPPLTLSSPWRIFRWVLHLFSPNTCLKLTLYLRRNCPSSWQLAGWGSTPVFSRTRTSKQGGPPPHSLTPSSSSSVRRRWSKWRRCSRWTCSCLGTPRERRCSRWWRQMYRRHAIPEMGNGCSSRWRRFESWDEIVVDPKENAKTRKKSRPHVTWKEKKLLEVWLMLVFEQDTSWA